jgi:hypothetical protein
VGALLMVAALASGTAGPAARAQRMPEDVRYRVEPPEGKVAWPHHRPDMSPDEYGRLVDSILVFNNFGEYQWRSGGVPQDAYFHDALDLVLPNGTVLYAIAAGTVRAVNGTPPHYATVVIEDVEQPGWAWSYTHVWNLKVAPGDVIGRGTPIGEVNFIRPGVDHVHLGRVFLEPGGVWTFTHSLVHVNPAPLFVFSDSEPPVIETPFHYARNATETLYPLGPATVSGDVDVIVGIRDNGEYSRSRGGVVTAGIPGALGVSRVEYEIADRRRALVRKVAFDWDRMLLQTSRRTGLRDYPRLSAVYFFHDAVQPPPFAWESLFYYYVVTNGEMPEDGHVPVDPAWGMRGWDTAARDESGRPQFPNGDYVITVRATDSAGNTATAQDVVRVSN